MIIKIPSKTQEFVVKAMDATETEYGDEFYERFKSITVDNGSEFLDFKGLERSIISPAQPPSSPEGSRSVITGRRTKGCIAAGCQGSR